MKDNLNGITVTDIYEIITFSSPKGRKKNIHNRKYFGLSFCTEGQITYVQNGKKTVSDKNHAILLPQGSSYILYGDKAGIFPVINFECMNFKCDSIVALPISNPETYIKDYEQMKTLFLFEQNRTKVISILYSILHHLSTANNPDSGILAPALKYLEQNFSDPELSNNYLAKLCGISEVYFRRLFKKIHRITPKQYVIGIRIDKAKQLLTDGILKINAIAENCGFSNPYHFCRIFKDKTGLSPSEYMKENKINKI